MWRSKTWLILFLVVVLASFGACNGDGGDAAACDTGEVETDEGVVYRNVECGEGPEAESGDTAYVHYTGRLEDGTEFDSSEGREPIRFVIGAGEVIPGWDIGISGMRVGGTRELTIPPELAYGEEGLPPTIPPDSTLVFDVELVELQKADG